MKVQVKIDNLVLHGFEYHDNIRISEAIKQELSRLIRESDISDNNIRSYTMSSANGLPFVVESNMNSRTIGKGVARAVFKMVTNSKTYR